MRGLSQTKCETTLDNALSPLLHTPLEKGREVGPSPHSLDSKGDSCFRHRHTTPVRLLEVPTGECPVDTFPCGLSLLRSVETVEATPRSSSVRHCRHGSYYEEPGRGQRRERVRTGGSWSPGRRQGT